MRKPNGLVQLIVPACIAGLGTFALEVSAQSSDGPLSEANSTVTTGAASGETPVAEQGVNPVEPNGDEIPPQDPQQQPAAPILDANAARIGFQGLLTDNSNIPLPGPTVDLTFRLYASGAAIALQTVPMPATPIDNGLVAVQVPFDPVHFDGVGREMSVQVGADPELSPRIPLAAAAHAYRVNLVESAELEDHVRLGEPGTVGSLTVYNTASDGPAFTMNGSTSILSVFDLNGAGERARLAARNYGELDLWDAVGTKTVELTGSGNGGLQRMLNTGGDETVRVDGEFGDMAAQNAVEVLANVPGGTVQARLSRDTHGGDVETWDETGLLTTRVGSSSGPNGGGFAFFRTGTNQNGVVVDGDDGGDTGRIFIQRFSSQTGQNDQLVNIDGDAGDAAPWIQLFDGRGERIRLDARGNGGGSVVSMFNDNDQQSVVIDGDDGNSGTMILYDGVGNGGVLAEGSDGNSGRVTIGFGQTASVIIDGNEGDGSPSLRMFNGANERIRLDANGSGGGSGMNMFNSLNNGTVAIDADDDDGGTIFLLDAEQDVAVELNADLGLLRLGQSGGGVEGDIIVHDNSGAEAFVVDSATALVKVGDSSGGSEGDLHVYSNAGAPSSIHLDGESGDLRVGWPNTQDGRLIAYSAISGSATVVIDGNNGMTTTRALTITGGAGLAEPFDVAKRDGLTIEAGMVVSIDATNAGQLKLADEPYDARVAGVISGANKLAPGLVMRSQGDPHADGDYNVALTGRVWCWCDASTAPIVAGDRLTTSNVAGHAMKVTNSHLSDGAVLGKAMTNLASGRGLVLVLVSLQ